jgi:hypothetical protein
MECEYKEIQIYYQQGKRSLFFSTGRNEVFGGVSAIGIPIDLKLPCNMSKIEDAVIDAFNNCYSESQKKIEKISVIEQYLGIKGFKKVSSLFNYLIISWEKGIGYKMTKTEREDNGSYNILVEDAKIFGNDLDIESVYKELQ